MPEKIYFCNFRTKMYGAPLPKKLHDLMAKAGFETLDLRDKFVAIKMHFGELGNLAFLRPNYAKAVADLVKEQGYGQKHRWRSSCRRNLPIQRRDLR